MNITIVSPGMEHDGNTLKTKSLGGSETAAIQLAEAFARAKDQFGNQNRVIVFSTCNAPVQVNNVQYFPLQAAGEFIYGASTDLLIVSRWQEPLMKPVHAKTTFLWNHDIALKRSQSSIRGIMYQIDKFLVMSKFQNKQYQDIYEIPEGSLKTIRNGVDLTAFPVPFSLPRIKGQMVYGARPERGLEALVRPGGIMDMFLERKVPVTLFVAHYDNTVPEMKGFYESLWKRCSELPNVRLVGSLTKNQLYDMYSRSWAYLYPTEFEEISCISAMEAQACGLPFITSPVAALNETVHPDAGIFVEGSLSKNETLSSFVDAVEGLLANEDNWTSMSAAGYAHSSTLSWDGVAKDLMDEADASMAKKTSSKARLYKHLWRNSDIEACKVLEKGEWTEGELQITEKERTFVKNGFDFMESTGKYREHYKLVDGPIDERNKGATTEHYEQAGGEPRMLNLKAFIEANKDKYKTILDYGCWIGQQTTRMANVHPEGRFVGLDITQRNIDIANECKAKHSLYGNVEFICTDEMSVGAFAQDGYDLVICNEVLEHVLDPYKLISELEGMCKPGGTIYLNVPYGPWEFNSYFTFPYRCHVRHFEMNDLLDIFGQKKDIQILYNAMSRMPTEEPVGHHYIIYTNDAEAPTGRINMERKLRWQNPKETLSVCMIAYNAEDMLHRCLKSVSGIADEIIIAVDPKTNDSTIEIAKKYGARVVQGVDPIVDGFDVARNNSFATANGDWILWIDSDEELLQPINIYKYLRNNHFNGYAIQQHHLSVDPPTAIKPDLPVRLFRSTVGMKFYGVVHEHPELELNKGVGFAVVLVDSWIAHDGYLTEGIRRNRFLRNIDLVKRDRERYPERKLGHFLWLRDLIHLFRYRMEQFNGAGPDAQCFAFATEAKELFEKRFLTDLTNPMLVDALGYYSEANSVLNLGHRIKIMMQLEGQGPIQVEARFPNSDVAATFIGAMSKNIIASVEGRYM